MLRALRARDGWRRGERFPALTLRWENFRVVAPIDVATIIDPHLYGFRLAMAMLTHPAWPIPPWGFLQVRSRMLLHRQGGSDLRGTLASAVCGWRVLEKGVEVDLRTQLSDGEGCAWESVVTYYSRGQFGSGEDHGEEQGASRVSPKIGPDCKDVARWITDGTQRWRYASWTGDYNGLHQWDWYARRLGFEGATAHPQRIVRQCLAHVAHPVRGPQQLDLWLRGPVRYGAAVTLREEQQGNKAGVIFSLTPDSSARPALIGSWRPL